MLGAPDPIQLIRELKTERQSYYDLAEYTVDTDGLTVQEVAREVIELWQQRSTGFIKGAPTGELSPSFVVEAASTTYPVFVDWGILDDLGKYLLGAGIRGPVYVITDSKVSELHGRQVEEALKSSGIEVHGYTVAAGEASKTLGTAGDIYTWLAEQRCERGHAIIAVGGGMVGDLAGFVAATFLRGVSVIQVPTSLAAMVDASIGGKTAVNLPAGKNLVGAFYQPRMVIADLSALKTLPPRELASGWAEAIKQGFSQVSWPGRMEVLSRNPLFVADGAHNLYSVNSLMESLKGYSLSGRLIIVAGFSRDKSVADMVNRLARVNPVSQAKPIVFAARSRHPRSLPAAAIAAHFGNEGIDAVESASVADAVTQALALASPGRGRPSGPRRESWACRNGLLPAPMRSMTRFVSPLL